MKNIWRKNNRYQQEEPAEMVQEKARLALAGELQDQYRKGRDYQQAMGLNNTWQENERMKVGQQWPLAGPRTKHLPRPVFNIVEQIISHKTASIVNENLKLSFSPEVAESQTPRAQYAAELYSGYAANLWQELEQSALNEQVLDAAATYGTGIWHYYWDNSYIGGGSRKYCGTLQGEMIDPANCFFGNPQVADVQKQPWIIIAKREPVAAAQARARANRLPDSLISADQLNQDRQHQAGRTELDRSEMVTVLTRYQRKADGRIWYCQSAGGVAVTMPVSLGLQRYPLEAFNWKLRKGSIYGVSEVEGIIPNQKAINFIMAMLMLSVQDTAWPKLVAKPGALNQQLTNMPGEVVFDNYLAGEGIRYLNGAPLSVGALGLADKVYDLTRNISGAHQVATGEIHSRNLSGAAIMALQRAASVATEPIKRRFLRSLVNIGRIWEDFLKHKYTTERLLVLGNDQGNQRLIDFVAADYADVPLALKIDAGAAADYSEVLMMTTIDNFLAAGHITFEEALEFMPAAAVPFREALLRRIAVRREAEATLMAAELLQEFDQVIAPPGTDEN